MQKSIEIRNGRSTLRGMLHLPDNIYGKVPIIIILHGFQGNKAGPHSIFVEFSRLMEQKGIASIRFDFRGSGESDGNFSDMTMSDELEDAKIIIDYVKTLSFADTRRLGVLGLSMGGAIASMLAGDRKDDVKSLCLWAPAGNMAEVIIYHYIGERLSELFETGYTDIEGFLLGKGFVEDAKALDIYGIAARYTGNVLILHGDKDDVVPIEASQKYVKYYGDKSVFNVIKDAGHTFDKREWTDEVLNKTADFFIKELG
jgi:pimeloyl-ACP methyl ester carboxylesterase